MASNKELLRRAYDLLPGASLGSFYLPEAHEFVIARGEGMARRSARQAAEMQQQTDQYIRQTAGAHSPSDESAGNNPIKKPDQAPPPRYGIPDKVIGEQL